MRRPETVKFVVAEAGDGGAGVAGPGVGAGGHVMGGLVVGDGVGANVGYAVGAGGHVMGGRVSGDGVTTGHVNGAGVSAAAHTPRSNVKKIIFL